MPRATPSWLLGAAVCVLSWATGACASIPAGRSAVDSVTVEAEDGARLDEDDVKEKISTAPSSRFLGLFPGFIYDYELFDRVALQRDLARVERYYRARGYYEAHVRAGRVLRVDERHVRVEIVVEEGEPVVVGRVLLEGPALREGELSADLRRLAAEKLESGAPFDEATFEATERALLRLLTDRGRAHAKVKRDAVVDLVKHRADVVFTLDAGPPAVFGPVTITGLGDLPEAPVRRALDLAEGEPYSTEALEDARQAALDLGVFTSVEITPRLKEREGGGGGGDAAPASSVVPLDVKVEPSKLRSVRLGAGAELDVIRADVHLIAGWESRNFFGGMRHFSASFQPGLVLYPLRIDNWTKPERALPEFKLRTELRQPGFLEARTSGFVRPELNLFPVLLRTDPQPEDPITGYLELKASTGVDRVFWKLFGSLSYNIQIEAPLSYKGHLDEGLRTLVISYPELLTNLDLSDSRLSPHEGVFLGNKLQFAGGPFGGHADDVRVEPDARFYVPVTKRGTLAFRAALGFLLPFNYGDSVRDELNDGAAESSEARSRDLQLVFFRGLFAGGPSSNRGYPLRSIGPHGFVPSQSPAGAAALAACDDPDSGTDCRVPVGGFSRWEASAETRFVVSGPFTAALFCDAADVSPETVTLRLHHLHLSCGAGARYQTPVGPIRLDIGYRIPGLQVLGPADPGEKTPDPLFGVLPVAIAFGIGEAF